jgi:hypothetical protein
MTNTPEPLPDVPIPKPGEPNSRGFIYNLIGVMAACSSHNAHAFGTTSLPKIKGGMELYSTRLLALKAMRHAAEKQFARELAAIDRSIEKEKQKANQ